MKKFISCLLIAVFLLGATPQVFAELIKVSHNHNFIDLRRLDTLLTRHDDEGLAESIPGGVTLSDGLDGRCKMGNYGCARPRTERQILMQRKRTLQKSIRVAIANDQKYSHLEYELRGVERFLKTLVKDQQRQRLTRSYAANKAIQRRRAAILKRRLELQEQGKLTIRPVKVSQPGSSTSTETAESIVVGEIYESGQASYYADMFDGRTTASGEVFYNNQISAAHKTLAFGTRVRVTNTSNGNTVDVTINDRGPYSAGRVIDLSQAAFSALDNLSRGVIDVDLQIIE